jgi:hypothetical protein
MLIELLDPSFDGPALYSGEFIAQVLQEIEVELYGFKDSVDGDYLELTIMVTA